jgi:hypothetical protein
VCICSQLVPLCERRLGPSVCVKSTKYASGFTMECASTRRVNDSAWVRVCVRVVKCVPKRCASGSVASGVNVFVREQVNCVVSAAAVWVRAAAALSELAVTPPRVQDLLSCSELSGMQRAMQSTL